MDRNSVYRIADFYQPEVKAHKEGKRWVAAVCEPYPVGYIGRIRAAVQILMGSAVAIRYPEPGDIEAAFAARK